MGSLVGENMRVKLRRIDRQLMLASVGIGVGLTLMIFGFNTGLTGRDASNLPDEIEAISPGDNERVLRQSQVIVDFVDGYTAKLFIDGIELPTTRLDEITTGSQVQPGAQIDLPPTAIFDPGNYRISFLPQKGAPIETFTQGEHIGRVEFWPIDGDENQARSYTWTFVTD
jgi:hypothetical protein